MAKGFSKRIFTARLFITDLVYVVWHLPQIIKILFFAKDTGNLFEKIFVVTDAVNDCVYCAWMDARLAIKSGISQEEVQNMMQLQFHTSASEYELPALLYAQHYAESNRKPDPNMTKGLFEHYGNKLARDIIVAIRAINFGNAYFNTWGAVISRFQGRPAANSNVLFELFYFLINFIIIMPFVILRKLDKKAITPVS